MTSRFIHVGGCQVVRTRYSRSKEQGKDVESNKTLRSCSRLLIGKQHLNQASEPLCTEMHQWSPEFQIFSQYSAVNAKSNEKIHRHRVDEST